MITEDQQEKLYPLTLHPKFGKLLISAMKTWETTIPFQQTYGVTRYNHGRFPSNWEIHKDRDRCCCLIGASVVGKKFSESVVSEASNAFHLSEIEIRAIIQGFDSSEFNDDNEAFQFGKKVSEIVIRKRH